LTAPPATFAARRLDRAVDVARSTPSRLSALLGRGAHAGDVAAKTLAAGRDAALEAAEDVTRGEGVERVADALHEVRTGGLDADNLPIDGYETLNVTDAVSAIKELTNPSDVRMILAFEEANKNRQGVVSASQTQIAAIAKDVVRS
jgi:hypothetical protein